MPQRQNVQLMQVYQILNYSKHQPSLFHKEMVMPGDDTSLALTFKHDIRG